MFTSWNNPRAQTYRKLNELPENAGTAVIIQAMVFGNMGQSSGSGVVFTRNPANGNKECYGEFLMNAEGEDMTSGSLIPRSLKEFKEESPTLFNQLFQLQKPLNSIIGTCRILNSRSRKTGFTFYRHVQEREPQKQQ